jgi:hypothetical protein
MSSPESDRKTTESGYYELVGKSKEFSPLQFGNLIPPQDDDDESNELYVIDVMADILESQGGAQNDEREALVQDLFKTGIEAGNLKISNPSRIPEIENNLKAFAKVIHLEEKDLKFNFGTEARKSVLRTDHGRIRSTRTKYLARFKQYFRIMLELIDSHFNLDDANLMGQSMCDMYTTSLDESTKKYFESGGSKGVNRCREYRRNLLSNSFNVEQTFGFEASYCVRSGPWSDSELVDIVQELSALLTFEQKIPSNLPQVRSAIHGAIYALTAFGMQDPYAEKFPN